MKTVFFDLVCGAGGDMILSCLLDLGVPVGWLTEQLDRLGLHGTRIELERDTRSGIGCAHVKVIAPHQHEHRQPHDIVEIIEGAGYSQNVTDRSKRVLMRLAQAEASVHQVPLDQVHFHEIGAVDTIIDIAGTCLCLEHLGIEKILFSTLTHGRGTVTTAHGVMPVPAPATAEMMRGMRSKGLPIDSEILTPTGCAILTALVEQCEIIPEGVVGKTGYGCGDKVFENFPNLLRAILVETGPAGDAQTVCVMESDMDHVSGEVLGYVAGRLMEQGALDVSWTPVYMKKGRPGYRLTVVCGEASRESLADTIFYETRTLGIRYHTPNRIVARRAEKVSEFLGAEVHAKECAHKNMRFVKPEFESLAALARSTGRPLIELAEEYTRRVSGSE